MTAFLASVRNLAEAELAVAAGADWIDLKDPVAGALGAVDPATVADVVNWMTACAIALPISATIGDCWDSPHVMPTRVRGLRPLGIGYLKIGVYAALPGAALLKSIRDCCATGTPIILVCFAEAPPHACDIAAFADCGIAGVMLDTAEKSGSNLLGRMSVESISEFVRAARLQRLLCGLAGSLRLDDIDILSSLDPDYLGFRGALCDRARREAALSERATASVRARIDQANAKRAQTSASPHFNSNFDRRSTNGLAKEEF